MKKYMIPATKNWLREPSPGKQAEPSSYEVYDIFSKMITASFDDKTSMLNVSVEYYSPEIAKEWVDLLVLKINDAFRVRDVTEAQKNIAYLEDKIQQTSIAEMQKVFYGMVESQMKTLMLAEVDDEYLIKQVVTPQAAERKSKPKRSLIVIIAVLLGGVFSCFVVLFKGMVINRK
ncbi:MAG: hypothetical protein U5M23_13445 [Marinagarivorans sp.]|nr:hypothetical protein [Marinagarivorans sp.]